MQRRAFEPARLNIMGKATCFFVVLSFDLASSQMVLLCHLMIGRPDLGSEKTSDPYISRYHSHVHLSRHTTNVGLLRA